MQIFKCKEYPEYEIVAYSYETSNSWGHKATLMHNGTRTLNNYKIRYYNRTWECYQYQSVIKAVISDYINYLIENFITDYKEHNNIKRLRADLKQSLIKDAKSMPIIQKLETFYGEL